MLLAEFNEAWFFKQLIRRAILLGLQSTPVPIHENSLRV